MSFRHDSTGVDPNAEPGIALMPDGWYTMKIFEAEEQVSKSKNDMVFCKCSPVNEPEYADAEIWHWVVFLPKERKGAGMSVQFRQAIGVPYGGDDEVDANDWIGKKFSAYIVTESYVIEEGKRKGEKRTKNKISSVRSLADADAATRAVSASANGAPASKSTPRAAEIVDDDVPF